MNKLAVVIALSLLGAFNVATGIDAYRLERDGGDPHAMIPARTAVAAGKAVGRVLGQNVVGDVASAMTTYGLGFGGLVAGSPGGFIGTVAAGVDEAGQNLNRTPQP
jgi:hypothetical protein